MKKEISKAIELMKEACNEQIPLLRILNYDNREYDLWWNRMGEILKVAFGRNSEEYSEFLLSGLEITFRPATSLLESQERYKDKLDCHETTFKKIIQKYEVREILATPETRLVQTPREAVYPSGKPYDAYKDIIGILSIAMERLIIVDTYVDSTLFDMLNNAQPKAHIQILTNVMKGDFQVAGKKFKDQREESQQGTIEIRKSDKFHDRFIIADEKIFHIGASIKDFGSKACFMSEVEGTDIKTTLNNIISEYWAEAKIVL